MWLRPRRTIRDERTTYELCADLEELELDFSLPRWAYNDYEWGMFVIRLSKLRSLIREINED